MSTISHDKTVHLVRLPCLALTDVELDELAGRADGIINHIQTVRKAAADDVKPVNYPSLPLDVVHKDVIKPTLTVEQTLDQTPSQDRQCFEVPQISSEQGYVEEVTVANPNLRAAVAEDPVLGLSALEPVRKICARELTSVEVTQAFPNRITATNEDIHVFLYVGAEEALAVTRKVDESLDVDEESTSALTSAPLALKGVFTTTDVSTTYVSKVLEGCTSPYDATVTAKPYAAGVPIPDKTDMGEFAMGSSTENSAYGPTHNPWNVERTAGDSDGDFSATLAPDMAPLAIGTDTDGSIRQPATLTAAVSVKPTCSTVPHYGLVICTSSLGQGGLTARTVLGTALLYEIIAGHDENGSTSTEQPITDVVTAAKEGVTGDFTGVKVGIAKQSDRTEGYQAGVLDSFHEAVDKLKEIDAETVEVDCPNFDHALSTCYPILPRGVNSNLARFDGIHYGQRVGDDGTYFVDEVMAMTRIASLDDEVKRRIIIDTYTLSVGYYDAYYIQAQHVYTLIQQGSEWTFEKVDVLISPTTPIIASKLDEKVDDPLSMYMSDLCTLPLNPTDMCGMSVPSGLAEDTGPPVDLQTMTPRHGDGRLYKVSVIYKRAHGPIA